MGKNKKIDLYLPLSIGILCNVSNLLGKGNVIFVGLLELLMLVGIVHLVVSWKKEKIRAIYPFLIAILFFFLLPWTSIFAQFRRYKRFEAEKEKYISAYVKGNGDYSGLEGSVHGDKVSIGGEYPVIHSRFKFVKKDLKDGTVSVDLVLDHDNWYEWR